MELGNKFIPEVLNDFKVYNGDGDELIGITADMSLAELSNQVASITGAGIAGTYDVPVAGHYDSIKQEIPFRMLYKPVTALVNPLSPVRINVRGAIQATDRSTGVTDFAGFRYVVYGRTTAINPGSAQPANPMNSSVTVEATYVLIQIDGETVFELDKLNNICKINGVDVMEKVRRYC